MYVMLCMLCLLVGFHEVLYVFITCGARLLNADWLRKGAFLLNHEGTFGNQEGMIT